MAISVRLDKETERLLARLARARKTSRSEVVRQSIHLLAEHDPATEEMNPYEAIKHIIGKAHGGPPDLSERTGEKFRQLLMKKKVGR